MKRQSVFLVGFMRVGKSTLGRLLAGQLERPFCDLDELIEERAGFPIEEIWSRQGEAGFRDLERLALEEVAGDSRVIATGGGVVERDDNCELLRQTGFVLWLRCPFAVIWGRRSPGGEPIRPLWGDKDSLERLFSSRQGRYSSVGTAVDVGRRDPAEEAANLARLVRAWERTN